MMTPANDHLALIRPAGLQDRLAAWFADVRRDLPWRTGDDLYGIWISEIMLQQTTVQAVVPYWERFMRRFPTVADLAAAPEQDVLSQWAGLGYYSRARNLHAAARTVVDQLGGRLPATREQWQALPGVGPYASGAIASIGLGERVPALDANARRVLARWAVTNPEAWSALTAAARDRAVDSLGAELVPGKDPGTWNEALMELGALVCGARRAACGGCPVRTHCRAGQGDWADVVPPPRRRATTTEVALAALVVRWRGHVLLTPPASPPVSLSGKGPQVVVRENFSGLHRGLWGVPTTVWVAGRDPVPLPDLAWEDALNIPTAARRRGVPWSESGPVRHGITRYRLNVTVLSYELDPHWEPPVTDLSLGAIPLGSGVLHDFAAKLPPLSRLAEKVLQFQQDFRV